MALGQTSLLESIVVALGDGVVVVDAAGELLVLNPAAEQLLQAGLGWLLDPRGSRTGGEELPLARALRGETVDNYDLSVPASGHGAPASVISLSARPIDGGGAVLTMRDVTAARVAEESMREAEERFRLTFENAPVGMALVATDGDSGRLLQVNAALAALAGRSEAELLQCRLQDLLSLEDAPVELELRSRLLAGELSFYAQQVRLVTPEGAVVWAQLHASVVRDGRGRTRYAIVHAEDAGQRKRFADRLQHLADHDALTGLLNRRRLQEELALHRQRCLRYGPEGVLLLIDLDGFKDVNDTLGHGVGDEVLRSVAILLGERLRTSDIVARLGGDEFAVLLPRADLETGERVAQDIVDLVAGQFFAEHAPRPIRLSASVGVTAFTGEPLQRRDVLAEADVALYEAKDAGRGCIATYVAAGQQQRMASRLSWADRIHEALEGQGFVLLAQPVHDYGAGRVTHHELLLRMTDPDGTFAPPSRFLPVAEQFGTIRAVDRWVLREAVQLLKTTPRDGRLLVNLSAASLADEDLGRHIAQLLDASGQEPSRLVLEITETAAIAHMDRARVLAEELRALGCGLALDDFGAAFSSFYYLKHLPVDILKIDGEFVRDVAQDAISEAVVRAVVQTARSLGRRTIAESVEDEAAFDFLRELGVDAAQGFHVGRPAPLDAMGTSV